MNRMLFERFYLGHIDRIANELQEKNSEFNYVPNLNGVYEEYLNQVAFLRLLVKKGDTDDETDDDLLDGHKVASCIVCAVVKARLITNSKIDDDSEAIYKLDRSHRLNEQFALLCGLNCLLAFMPDNKKDLLLDTEIKKIKLFYPKTTYEKQPEYLSSLVRTLYYSNTISAMNPLLLSHIFFLLEQYHRLSVRAQNNGVNIKDIICD